MAQTFTALIATMTSIRGAHAATLLPNGQVLLTGGYTGVSAPALNTAEVYEALSDTDGDGDGVPDTLDNCTLVPNPDQRDTDGDNYGNMCDGDLNNDGATNTLDLNIYKLAHRSKLGDPNYNPNADFNGDGQINTLDLNIYKGLHRKPPGPSGLVK